jgi:hypothetical protein
MRVKEYRDMRSGRDDAQKDCLNFRQLARARGICQTIPTVPGFGRASLFDKCLQHANRYRHNTGTRIIQLSQTPTSNRNANRIANPSIVRSDPRPLLLIGAASVKSRPLAKPPFVIPAQAGIRGLD